MATLDQHQSDAFLKMMYIGDSSTGKTGSLASLLADDYTFKIIDMDNGLDSLVQYGRVIAPDKLGNVEFETFRDTYHATKMGPIVRKATAFTDALAKMEEWGKLEDPNCIFVLDSLSTFGKAAFEWAKGMNPTAKDPRQWYFSAQGAIENVLALLTSDAFKLNVIIISHVNYKEITEGVHKGYASAIGSALGPSIPKYFNTLILAETIGAGANVKRRIKTMPTGVIDLKISSPKIDKELPLDTGMSTIFKTLKGN